MNHMDGIWWTLTNITLIWTLDEETNREIKDGFKGDEESKRLSSLRHVLGPESQMFLYPHPLSSLARGEQLSRREATAGPSVAISKLILETRDGPGWEK